MLLTENLFRMVDCKYVVIQSSLELAVCNTKRRWLMSSTDLTTIDFVHFISYFKIRLRIHPLQGSDIVSKQLRPTL